MVARVLRLSVFVFIALLEVTGRLPEDFDAFSSSCTSKNFKCFNGNCIQRNVFCDGYNNCGDNSDEEYCKLQNVFWAKCLIENWFRCTDDRRCIPGEWKCDSILDCPDGSDEQGCEDTDITFWISGVQAAKWNLTERFLGTRKNVRSIDKWGPSLLKTAVALYTTGSYFTEPEDVTSNEIAYELSLQMMSKLALKEKISTEELSLFINALTVACINPKDFFGVDLVAELRTRINSNYNNPFTFLTLCTAGDSMTATDVLMVNSTFYARHRPLWTDTQAFATMAMACMSSRSNLETDREILKVMVKELKGKQHKNGTIDNLRTTTLVLQALIATKSYNSDFDLGGAMKFVMQAVNYTNVSFEDMYYILPVLSSKSLADISSNHCIDPVVTELDMFKKIQENQEERIEARVSVLVGNEMTFVRTWRLKVPEDYSFYQVLETIGSMEPSYKVQYSVTGNGKPYVVGVSKFFDDAQEGLFWFVYTQNLKNSTEQSLVEKSPVDIELNEDEGLILWYRSGTWTDPQSKVPVRT